MVVAGQNGAHAAKRAIGDVSLEIRAVEGAAAVPLRAARLILLAERRPVFERFAAVVSSLEAKGGDPAEVHGFRGYIAAVAVQETFRLTVRELADSALNWLLSRDGGVRLAFRIAVVGGAHFVLFVVARIVRGWVRHRVDRVPSLSMLPRGFIVMVCYWLNIAFALAGHAGQPCGRPHDQPALRRGRLRQRRGKLGNREIGAIVSTTVATPDNRVIVIPDRKVWSDEITNTSASDTRRVDLVFGIGHGDPFAKAQAVIATVVAGHPLALNRPSRWTSGYAACPFRMTEALRVERGRR